MAVGADAPVAGRKLALSSAIPASEKQAGEPEGGGDFVLDPNPDSSKIAESLTHYPGFYRDEDCSQIEAWIDDTVAKGSSGQLAGEHTVDETPFRSKYFFGFGYSYGRGMRGKEELLPPGSVCDVPEWVYWLLVRPLEDCGIVPPGWVDSVVMNDYRAGSSIVAHVDPPRLFARPIVTVSFFHPARLVFGASFDPERTTPPAYVQELSRGSVLLLDGYAANRVTHGIRPEDLQGTRRVSLILRHVMPGAPGYPTVPPPGNFLSDYPMRLLGQVQGYWRDPPGNRHSCSRYYFVQGLLVTVLVSARKGAKAAADGRLPGDIWQLTPTGEGLVLHNGLLEQSGVSKHALFWRGVSGFLDGWPARSGPGAKFGGFTWLRADG